MLFLMSVLVVIFLCAGWLMLKPPRPVRTLNDVSGAPIPDPGERVQDFFERCSNDPYMQQLYPNAVTRMHACDGIWRLSTQNKPLSSSG